VKYNWQDFQAKNLPVNPDKRSVRFNCRAGSMEINNSSADYAVSVARTINNFAEFFYI